MEPPSRPLTLNKLESAKRQIRAAIDAFWRGDFDISVTLAGAAEGQVLDPPADHPVRLLKDLDKGIETAGSRTEWNKVINLTRDWLKHATTNLPDTVLIQRSDAAFMIYRALLKLQVWHTWDDEEMETFRVWLVSNLDALDGDEGKRN